MSSDPSPSFLERIVPNTRFDSNYFLSLNKLLSAPDVKWRLVYIRTFNGVNFIINPASTSFIYKGDACLYGGEDYLSRPLPHQYLAKALVLSTRKIVGYYWSQSSCKFLYLVVKLKFHPVVKHIGTKDNFVEDYLS